MHMYTHAILFCFSISQALWLNLIKPTSARHTLSPKPVTTLYAPRLEYRHWYGCNFLWWRDNFVRLGQWSLCWDSAQGRGPQKLEFRAPHLVQPLHSLNVREMDLEAEKNKVSATCNPFPYAASYAKDTTEHRTGFRVSWDLSALIHTLFIIYYCLEKLLK